MRRGWFLVSFALVLGGASPGARQQSTPPDVFMAVIDDGGTSISDVVNATNNPGYDNQPTFVSNRQLLFSSNREGTQTDIYRYDFKSGELTRLTKTDESEYSPQPTPDGKGFSTVRLESDGAQRLWEYRNNGTRPEVLFENAKRIGYYAWIDRTRVALAVLDARGTTMSLQFADTTTGAMTPMASNIGRSLARRPDTDEISFIAKYADAAKPWMIRTVDVKTKQFADVVSTVKGSEDLAWMPNGDLLMGHGTAIYRWTRGHTTWTKFADLPPKLCTNVTRLAVSPDGKWLAFVAEPIAKPAR